jgi:outer membrane protein
MNKLLFAALAVGWSLGSMFGCRPSHAETPALNPMPDGSRDMYAGVGVQSAPRYDGTGVRRVRALPVLQAEWSNGLFVSGMRAGWHLSDSPTLEYGPLLGVVPKRDGGGNGNALGEIGNFSLAPPLARNVLKRTPHGLDGIDEIGARLQAGAFLNVYLDPQWRLSASVLVGSGRERDGARLELDVQRLAATIGERHRVSLAAGVTAANRKDNASYFGVSVEESLQSRFDTYAPGGGLQDAHLDARWNWSWSPSWMMTTDLRAKRLLGSAGHSPLVERSSNLTVSTAIAYRF